MEKFRWAYIGSGNIAKSTAMNIKKGNHIITAVYSRNPDSAKAFAKRHNATAYDDFESAVNAPDVDAVYIASPHTSHLDYAINAMKLGKPVLCEKPVGVSLDEVKRMTDFAKENNVYFCEAMWTWFSDVAKTVKKWVSQGAIGNIKSVEIDYAFPGLMMSKNSRVLTPETAGGALLDIGIYPITYCYNIFGYPDKITCDGVIKNGIDVKETVTLTYGDMKCTLNMALDKLRERCVIKGADGCIKIPMFHMASIAVMKNSVKTTRYHGKTDYLTEFDKVSQEIRSGKTESDYIPFSASCDCMKIMDECRRQMGLIYPFEEGYNED
ncbi:MAG: Gfo/Idh/MocA family oxidoreductase [Eubacterium sp.]|nr:Gfo/Idh/MocA family oxidoreductase [Eubacterium sp.]